MDLESPADAWYVWIGVALVSVIVAGIVLALPATPPPDARGAASAIDRVSGSPYNASATYEHTADEIRIENRSVALRNDDGTARSTLAFGEAIYVTDEGLENVTYGASLADEFGSDGRSDFLNQLDDEELSGWRPADSELVVRTVSWGPPARIGDPDEYAEGRPWLTYDDDEGEFRVTLVTS